MTWCSCEFPLL